MMFPTRTVLNPVISGCRLRTSSGISHLYHAPVRLQHVDASSSHLPRLLQPSLWESVFPRSLRQQTKESFQKIGKGPANPQTYFVWIYIIIGSQAIKILSIKNEFDAFMRTADMRIGKLREVVGKLQKGESVDVERVLGTGILEEEQEWEDALREIENEERIWQEGKRKRQEEQEKVEAEKQDASPVSPADGDMKSSPDLPTTLAAPAPSRPGFY